RMNSTWPEWVVNLGILATFIGTFFTFFVLYQTSSLSKMYNKKIGGEYLTTNIKKSYEKFTVKIKDIKKDTLTKDDGNLRHEFWSLITECNGYITVCKKEDTDKSIYVYVEKFKSDTLNLQGNRNIKDYLTYDSIWSYYNSLAVLHEALRNVQSMSAQKV
ncbi:hypothetical protein ACS6HQ_21690, partial [Enterobacter hormaechei subsp. steigerwaltii]|nr:hypothetical protein [Enterobacter hormaechei]HDV8195974.1 hypothetical protein [Enterobacter hormaechei]HED3018383.1 hypothetical protein [Enterobacter hormaechei subsp. steigerwaltii]